jgi:hypothetical protein
MDSEEDKNKIDTYLKINNQGKQISTIVTSTTNFISDDIQSDVPNSEANFITREDIKNKNDKNNKRKMKQILKIKDNILVINKNKERKKDEIYNYLMKNEDMNNIQNIKELRDLYAHNEIFNFIFSRLDKKQTLKCNIFLNSENNVNNYILYSHSHKFILGAKYDFALFHNNYIFYTSRNFLPSTAIAKLHSYSQKNEFILYDMGQSPKLIKNKKINTSNVSVKIRRYLLEMKYLNDKKFQNFNVFLPQNDYFENYHYNMDENHKDKLSNKNYINEVIVLENNKPKYDINTKKFIDSYSDRVKEKSKFNFKILYENNNNKNMSFECGKINENNYVLDIAYPLSPLEGFAIALSNFVKNK